MARKMMDYIPLRFFTVAVEVSATAFFTFLGFSASCSDVEAAFNQPIFCVECVINLRRDAYPCASSLSDP
jgi:hypothetical protein